MRQKGEILSECLDRDTKARVFELPFLTYERLRLEVLIDIRDQLPVLSTLLARLLANTTQDP